MIKRGVRYKIMSKEEKERIYRSYKFRVYPDREQRELINKTLGCVRFVYNYCRGEQKKKEDMWVLVNEMVQKGYFTENRYKSEFFNTFENIKYITQLKKTYEWLKEVDNKALQSAVENLGMAYKRYYKGLSRRPRFKSKRNPVQSYTTKCNNVKEGRGGTIRIEGKFIRIPKVGKVKMETSDKLKDKMKGRILRATITKTNTHKFYISIICELDREDIGKVPKTGESIGIDLGIEAFCTLSNGEKKENHKYLEKSIERIIKYQKQLSRKKIGSSNYKKAKLKVSKAYERVGNQRKDYIQKLSTELIRKYDVICIEDLGIKNMVKNSNIAKSILDVSWGEFIRVLKYKAEWYGKKIIEVGRFYPSSQLCNVCGYKNKEIKNLSIREWECPCCGSHHDRDVNASINILKEGKRLLSI